MVLIRCWFVGLMGSSCSNLKRLATFLLLLLNDMFDLIYLQSSFKLFYYNQEFADFYVIAILQKTLSDVHKSLKI